MKYESEFRIKEREFRPRENYSHQQGVDALANIVKRADLDIEELCAALDNECKVNEELYDQLEKANHYKLEYGAIAILSIILNGIFIVSL